MPYLDRSIENGVPLYYEWPDVVIRVDPVNLFRQVDNALEVYGRRIADSINGIVDTWNELKIGWVGRTKEEAEAFNDEWTAAISTLYGSKKDPEAGILTQIGQLVGSAAINYGHIETVVTKMFRDFNNSLIGPVWGTQPVTGGSNGRNVTDGPIFETSAPK